MNATQIKIGQPVKLVYGFGRTVMATISDIVTNKWGTNYEVTTEDGEVEYVSDFVTCGIGCHIVN